jgi:hypothetical protein
MASSAIKHRGPAQVHALDEELILLRKVDFDALGPNLVDTLRNTDIRPGEKEGDRPWFLDGYISVDQPRDLEMARAILAASKGLALARTDTGEVLAEFPRDQIERAERVLGKAKKSLGVDIIMEDEDESDSSSAVES